MLLAFRFSNHLSIKDEQEISLVASSLKDNTESVINIPNIHETGCLSSIVLYGANAAGKSNVIAALKRMQHEVMLSHITRGPSAPIDRSVFALDGESSKQPSSFEVDFIVNKVRYQYGYRCNSEYYQEEWLYSFPNGRTTKLFDRAGQVFSFGKSLRGRNKTIADLTRPNSLFLSAAMQNNHELLTEIGSFFTRMQDDTSVSVSGEFASQALAENKLDQRAIKILTQLGTGVCDYQISEVDISDEEKKFGLGIAKAFSELLDDSSKLSTDKFPKTRKYVKLGHQNNKNGITFFDFKRESAGTRRLLVILGPIFNALEKGSLILIDEFDASLHTKACELILALFNNKKTNPKGAQLIVTTHDTNLLRSEYLRRDQIWFAEKDETGATHIYPLTDISVQKSANLERGYLQGRFGAVPFSGSVEQFLRFQSA